MTFSVKITELKMVSSKQTGSGYLQQGFIMPQTDTLNSYLAFSAQLNI